MPFDGIQTRRHKRNAFATNIELCPGSSNHSEVCRAVSVDISDGGIGLYLFSTLNEGDNVVIKTTLPVPCQKARVCWVKQYGRDFCRVGLNFIA